MQGNDLDAQTRRTYRQLATALVGVAVLILVLGVGYTAYEYRRSGTVNGLLLMLTALPLIPAALAYASVNRSARG